MRNPEYSYIEPNTGNVVYSGPLTLEKGDHSHMPKRTEAYLPGDERGHVNASSLGGINSEANIVPQHADLNHGAYLSVEKGERTALQNGAVIDSEKTAVVNGHYGDRPVAFLVNDSISYQDGHTETIYHSFTNESYVDQSIWNDMTASLPDTFDAPNPADGLRSSMDTEAYSVLMETTDLEMSNLDADYVPADFSGLPDSIGADSVSVDADMDFTSTSTDCSADPNSDIGGTDAGSGDGGTSADAE